MKAFIDRLYCFYDFEPKRPSGWSTRLGGQNRKAIVASVCEQLKKKDMGVTLDAMRIPLEALGYDVIQAVPVFGFFDKGKVKDDPELLERISQLGEELAMALD